MVGVAVGAAVGAAVGSAVGAAVGSAFLICELCYNYISKQTFQQQPR